LDLPQGLDHIPREVRTTKPPREKLSPNTAKTHTSISEGKNLTQQGLEPNPHTTKKLEPNPHTKIYQRREV
jgi:hypothetical protein